MPKPKPLKADLELAVTALFTSFAKAQADTAYEPNGAKQAETVADAFEKVVKDISQALGCEAYVAELEVKAIARATAEREKEKV